MHEIYIGTVIFTNIMLYYVHRLNIMCKSGILVLVLSSRAKNISLKKFAASIIDWEANI